MRRRTSSPDLVTSRPSTRATPWVGASRPQRMRISVDLPEPFGPSRPKISPRGTRSETLSSARTLPKSRLTPSTSMPYGLTSRAPAVCVPAARAPASAMRHRGPQVHERGHAGLELGRGLDDHLDAEDLLHALLLG